MTALANTISDYDFGDGRYFRDAYPCGYEGMSELHGLQMTFADKSEEFKREAKSILTYPDMAFLDSVV